MDKSSTLLSIADSLRSAADGAAWEQLADTTRALAPQLEALAARGPLSQTERSALQRLREAHDYAAEAVNAAARSLHGRLEEMRSNKDGWLAYAMHGETEFGTAGR